MLPNNAPLQCSAFLASICLCYERKDRNRCATFALIPVAIRHRRTIDQIQQLRYFFAQNSMFYDVFEDAHLRFKDFEMIGIKKPKEPERTEWLLLFKFADVLY